MIWDILKNVQEAINCVSFSEIRWLMAMQMRLKMKNNFINRPRLRHEHKYAKYKTYFIMVMVICYVLSKAWATFETRFMQK